MAIFISFLYLLSQCCLSKGTIDISLSNMDNEVVTLNVVISNASTIKKLRLPGLQIIDNVLFSRDWDVVMIKEGRKVYRREPQYKKIGKIAPLVIPPKSSCCFMIEIDLAQLMDDQWQEMTDICGIYTIQLVAIMKQKTKKMLVSNYITITLS